MVILVVSFFNMQALTIHVAPRSLANVIELEPTPPLPPSISTRSSFLTYFTALNDVTALIHDAASKTSTEVGFNDAKVGSTNIYSAMPPTGVMPLDATTISPTLKSAKPSEICSTHPQISIPGV